MEPRYVDWDKYGWNKENILIYNKTHRIKYQGVIWERKGECSQCGCCYGEYEEFRNKQKDYPIGKKNIDGTYNCGALRKDGDKFYCAIWKLKGFNAIPEVCQVHPCTPTTFAGEMKKKCSFTFEDVTKYYE